MTASGPQPGDPDVQSIIAEIKATVERRKAAGEYPPDVVREIDQAGRPADTSYDLEGALAELRRYTGISLSVKTGSDRPVVGGLIRFVKGMVQRSIRWYFAGIRDQWNEFSWRAIKALYLAGKRIEELEERVATLENKALEKPDSRA